MYVSYIEKKKKKKKKKKKVYLSYNNYDYERKIGRTWKKSLKKKKKFFNLINFFFKNFYIFI